MLKHDASRNYVARTPGLKCQKCGKDISGRSPGTKWCFECSKEVANEATKQRKAYIAMLEARDKVFPDSKYVCAICGHISFDDLFFCGKCGQRLKEGSYEQS